MLFFYSIALKQSAAQWVIILSLVLSAENDESGEEGGMNGCVCAHHQVWQILTTVQCVAEMQKTNKQKPNKR